MFRIFDYLFHPKNMKETSGNFIDNEPVEKVKCQRCLRSFESHYVKCPYCDFSELHKSMIVDFFILRT